MATSELEIFRKLDSFKEEKQAWKAASSSLPKVFKEKIGEGDRYACKFIRNGKEVLGFIFVPKDLVEKGSTRLYLPCSCNREGPDLWNRIARLNQPLFENAESFNERLQLLGFINLDLGRLQGFKFGGRAFTLADGTKLEHLRIIPTIEYNAEHSEIRQQLVRQKKYSPTLDVIRFVRSFEAAFPDCQIVPINQNLLQTTQRSN